MGLGKTLQSISLCVANQPPPDWHGGATLIVVPKSLLRQWNTELHKWLKNPFAKGGIHEFYGSNKATQLSTLKSYRFVLTT